MASHWYGPRSFVTQTSLSAHHIAGPALSPYKCACLQIVQRQSMARTFSGMSLLEHAVTGPGVVRRVSDDALGAELRAVAILAHVPQNVCRTCSCGCGGSA